MWVKPHFIICVGVLLFTGFSQINGYFGETDEYRDFLPCGSELPLEPDQKYFIRSERFGGNTAPRKRPDLLFKRQTGSYYGQHANTAAAGNPRPLLSPAQQGSPHQSDQFQNPAHANFRRKNCIWKFHGNGNCQLMVHFDKYAQGDPLCTQQYVFVTDEDHEIQACENRILPPAFEAATKTITVKHYRTRRVARLSEFEGYAICHSLSGHEHRDASPQSSFSGPGNVPYYGNRGNDPRNYRPKNYNRLQNPLTQSHNDDDPGNASDPFDLGFFEGIQRRPSIRRLEIDTSNSTSSPTNTGNNQTETALPTGGQNPNVYGGNRRYNYRNPSRR